MSLAVQPVTLQGTHVALEPLSAAHAAGLWAIGQQADDWAWMPRGSFTSQQDCRDWIDEALAAVDQLPFAIIDANTSQPVGSSRYLAIRPEHRGLEIGWTWLGRDWQRTRVNTEAKLLLLGHAFETLGAIRVEFKTDERNTRSRAALERIGAVFEGTLRQHMMVQGGHLRNSVYYSIIDREWPAVKAALEEKLAA